MRNFWGVSCWKTDFKKSFAFFWGAEDFFYVGKKFCLEREAGPRIEQAAKQSAPVLKKLDSSLLRKAPAVRQAVKCELVIRLAQKKLGIETRL